MLPAVGASRLLPALAACHIVQLHHAVVAVELAAAVELHHVPCLWRTKADPTPCQYCKPQQVVALDAMEPTPRNSVITMCRTTFARLA